MKSKQLLVSIFISSMISTTASAYGGFVTNMHGDYIQTISGCLYYGDISEVKETCPFGEDKKMVKPMAAEVAKPMVEEKAAMVETPKPMAEEKVTMMAAPTPKPVVKKVINLKGVAFQTGSVNLTGASLNTLDSVAQQLKANKETKIIVAGHTDNAGNSEANLKLSQARAEAVREHLVAQGVAAEQLIAKGYGDAEAIASNDNAAGRAKNRRVELRILK